jgi:hypothetical protein
MDKFNRYFDEKDMPVCRFGPGGDFVVDWPAPSAACAASVGANPIGKVLETIAKIIGNVKTAELLKNSNTDEISFALTNIEKTENLEDVIDFNQSDEPDAQTAPGAQTGRKLSEEPMLFDNASGAGRPVRHKPVNGVRAHRRPKRKRASFSTVRQGSLFEPYPESSKVA